MNAYVETHASRRLLRRVGVAGFWFFLLKGFLWIASLGVALILAHK
jgi:hypothetical protein